MTIISPEKAFANGLPGVPGRDNRGLPSFPTGPHLPSSREAVR